MSVLQACQVDWLVDLDEGGGTSSDTVTELCWVTDLFLSVSTKRHLWLNLNAIKEKDKNLLMDGLFDDVFRRFRQEVPGGYQAAFQKLFPRHSQISGSAEWEQPRTSKASPAHVQNKNRASQRKGIREVLLIAALRHI